MCKVELNAGLLKDLRVLVDAAINRNTTANSIAKQAGISRSTLTRILTKEVDHSYSDTLRKIVEIVSLTSEEKYDFLKKHLPDEYGSVKERIKKVTNHDATDFFLKNVATWALLIMSETGFTRKQARLSINQISDKYIDEAINNGWLSEDSNGLITRAIPKLEFTMEQNNQAHKLAAVYTEITGFNSPHFSGFHELSADKEQVAELKKALYTVYNLVEKIESSDKDKNTTIPIYVGLTLGGFNLKEITQ